MRSTNVGLRVVGAVVVTASVAMLAACSGATFETESVAPYATGEMPGDNEQLVGANTLSFQDGLLPNATYRGAADTYLSLASPTARHGSVTPLRVNGDLANKRARSTLLRWDVSAIPSGSKVTGVTLSLNVSNASQRDYTVREVVRAWAEGTATWTSSGASAWEIAGASGATDRNATPLGTVSARSTGSITVTLSAAAVAVVQKWIDSPSTNNGFILSDDTNTDTLELSSREASTASARPKLTVAYSPVAASDAGTSDAAADASTLDSGAADSGVIASDSGVAIDSGLVDIQPSFPIRAAFYYPWFPDTWGLQNGYAFTNYHPTLGYYDTNTAVASHVKSMMYGKIQVGIASWWGQGSKTDTRIANLLRAADGTTFRWALYHENESTGDPTVAQINSDLAYIKSRYGNDPNFQRINGRPVVFVYADGNDGCAMADRWKQANVGVDAYVVLKVFSGYASCASQPDGWHQYGPATATAQHGTHSYVISPGFFLKGEATPRLARDLARWNQNIQSMIASGAKWQLITTFNEWGEGTAVESATEWASASGEGTYLDALHNDGK